MKITARMLEAKGACDNQLCLFAMYFGEAAEVTLTNCLVAAELGLDLNWAAVHLLSAPARDDYWAARQTAKDDAYWAAYKAAKDAYDAACQPARDACALAFYRAAIAKAKG